MNEKKIGEIKEELKAVKDTMLPDFISQYETDERDGVTKLVEQARKRLDKWNAEIERTEQLKKYEKEYAAYAHICGIDEVGRGPLAGPVVAGAVILPKDCDILYINDSKKLTAAKREELYDVIMEKACSNSTTPISGVDTWIAFSQISNICSRANIMAPVAPTSLAIYNTLPAIINPFHLDFIFKPLYSLYSLYWIKTPAPVKPFSKFSYSVF